MSSRGKSKKLNKAWLHDHLSDPYVKLAQPRAYDSPEQKAEAVKLLLSKLDQGKEPVAADGQVQIG